MSAALKNAKGLIVLSRGDVNQMLHCRRVVKQADFAALHDRSHTPAFFKAYNVTLLLQFAVDGAVVGE